MSSRVTRSRSKQQPGEAGGEQSEQKSSDAATVKRASTGGRKRKSKSTAEEKTETETKAESEPTLQLETAGEGDKAAEPGQQLKLVASDDKQNENSTQSGATSKEDEEPKAEEQSSTDDGEGWQDGHDSDTDYHEPQSPTQLVTLQQTDHRTAGGAPPSLPDDIDLSVVSINRAPVLTLWAAVLAHVGPAQLPWLSALTVGKAIAGMIAQSRGRSLGVFDSAAGGPHKRQKTAQERESEADDVQVMGIKVHMARVGQHVYATISNKPVNASQCDRYVHTHFGANRPRVIAAMKYLTHCILARGADGEADVAGRYTFTLYEQFRPNTADGQAPGWGQKGDLDLSKIVEMGKNELDSAKTEGKQLHLTTAQDMHHGGENTHSDRKEEVE